MAKLLDTLDPIFAACLLNLWESYTTRYQLDRPWVADGWVYATNGRIIVRQRSKRKDAKGRFPSASDIFGWTSNARITITLPRIGRKLPDLVRCPDCRGRGCGRVKYCVDGKAARRTKPVDLGCDEYGLADRYIWLLRDHGVTTVQPILERPCFAFQKGKIDGRVNGQNLIGTQPNPVRT